MREFLLRACVLTGLAYAGLMTASAAQNPCPPHWVETCVTQPILGDITCPGQGEIPDRCVGAVVVSASVAPSSGGSMQTVDDSGCGNPPGSPTPVPISPVTGWSIYAAPPGTTPTGGSGSTANLTVIHGGTVVVHFTNYAKLTSPPCGPWEELKSCKNYPLRVFEVVDLTPDLPPKSGPSGNPPQYNYCIQDADLTITATPVPSVAASELPACWTVTVSEGSGPVTIVDKLTARLSLRYSKYFRITCTAGTSSKSVIIMVGCPDESVTLVQALCGPDRYGAIAHVCFDCGAWVKEDVTKGPDTCPPYSTGYGGSPLPLDGGCREDYILNLGNPQNVGNCQDTTYQTVHVGPTEGTVNACTYYNTQTITVNQSTRTVTTSVSGSAYAQTSCHF